jgi:hypothetical protein
MCRAYKLHVCTGIDVAEFKVRLVSILVQLASDLISTHV